MLSTREDSTREHIFSCIMVAMDDHNILPPPRFSRVDFTHDDDEASEDERRKAEAQREAELELATLLRKHGIFPQSVTSWLEVVAQQGYVEAFNYSAVVSAGLNAFLHRREVQRLKREKAYLEQRKNETHRDAQTLAALAGILATGKDILAALGGPRRHDG
jgi:hypothetical protein